MSREIRITVDDDEVFERMKRRKRELDLSWEEVLHRGLGRDPEPDAGPASGPVPERGTQGGPSDRGRPGRGRGAESGRPVGDDPWDAFGESLESEIRNRVYDTLRSSFGAAGVEVPEREALGDDVAELEQAEDAALVFEFLDDRPAYRVPLRVNLRTGRDGIEVEVVAVRVGKNVGDWNRFDGDARKRVNAGLASGETATLRFADGAEEYAVRPVLAWGRDDAGRPTVSEVEIDEVVLDGER